MPADIALPQTMTAAAQDAVPSFLLPARSSDAAGWGALAVLAAAVVSVQLIDPLTIDPSSLSTIAFASVALGGAAFWFGVVRKISHFATMALALLQVLLFSALGSLLSYQLARYGGTLQDARLAAWDAATGFDWIAYVAMVDRSETLTFVYRLAYSSLIPQIILLVLSLGFTQRLAALRATMLAAMLTGTIIVMLSPLMPAVSNFVHLGLSPNHFTHVRPAAGFIHLADYLALRDGSFGTFSLDATQGIITFPSYHAALAAVTGWGFWHAPRWLRWPGVTLATLTILATPVDGGHYLVDVLAGLAIAAVCVPVAVRAIRWRSAE